MVDQRVGSGVWCFTCDDREDLNGDVQPTAALLARLIRRVRNDTFGVGRGAPRAFLTRSPVVNSQPTWSDSETGYVRRAGRPAASLMLQLVEIELPAS